MAHEIELKMADHDCHSLLASLSEYVDGELEETICQEIEAHMADCENCRVVVDTLQRPSGSTALLRSHPAGGGRARLCHLLDDFAPMSNERHHCPCE
jgi:anti-sigma factor RsiW